MLLLPTAFIPNIHYVSMLLSKECGIYIGEQYQKQSYRNRTDLLSANGVVSVSIPIQKIGYPSPPTSSVQISMHDNWQHRLEHLLISNYTNSPYWFHYSPDILELIHEASKGSLVEYNHKWLGMICRAWNITLPELVLERSEHDLFLPEVISPEYQKDLPVPKRYWQVFEQKFGFTPFLSCLDLLLNLGPEGVLYLQNYSCGGNQDAYI